MSLLGKAAVLVWNDVAPEALDDFLAWHNREHIAERIAIPAFRRGRRARAVSGGPEFLTLYEVSDAEALAGGDYLARLNDPTPWTRRVLPQFRNAARSLCLVELSFGSGVGGFLASVRLAGDLRRDAAALGEFGASASHRLREDAELLGVHLLARDLESSRQEIAEQRLRDQPVAMPPAVLLAEASSQAAAAGAAEELAKRLRELGLGEAAETAVYRHEFGLTAADLG